MSPNYQRVDPCQDFSRYVCEGWEQNHDLRPDQDGVSSGSVMYENSQRTLRHLLEAPYSDLPASTKQASADQAIFDKIQSAYDACMDEKTIQKAGSEPLLDVLRKIQEYYPPSHTSPRLENQQQKSLLDSGDYRLTNTIAYLVKIGVSAFVDFSIDADDKHPDNVVLMLSALRRPGLPSKEYYQDPSVVGRYTETIGQVLEALLREAHSSEHDFLLECSEELVEAIVRLEKNLALASPDEEDAEDVTKYYNPRSPAEVQALLPQLSMPELLSHLAPAGYVPEKVIVGSPPYVYALAMNLEQASYETIRAYLVWKTVQAYVDQIEDEALTPLKRFNNELRGKDPDASEERWRTCVRAVDRSLGGIKH
ncbi:MAG: hypothetical protein Q9183_006393 [Haloplaca sp. 2 TL-2023]